MTTSSTLTEPHEVIVGIGVMILFAVIATEVGGTSHGNAEIIILILVGLLLILGIDHMSNFGNWATSNPFVPSASQVQTQTTANQSAQAAWSS